MCHLPRHIWQTFFWWTGFLSIAQHLGLPFVLIQCAVGLKPEDTSLEDVLHAVQFIIVLVLVKLWIGKLGTDSTVSHIGEDNGDDHIVSNDFDDA